MPACCLFWVHLTGYRYRVATLFRKWLPVCVWFQRLYNLSGCLRGFGCKFGVYPVCPTGGFSNYQAPLYIKTVDYLPRGILHVVFAITFRIMITNALFFPVMPHPVSTPNLRGCPGRAVYIIIDYIEAPRFLLFSPAFLRTRLHAECFAGFIIHKFSLSGLGL